jgi:hypothetical protein
MSGAGTKKTISHTDSEASLPKSTEQKRTDNAMRIIQEEQQTILRATDMLDARRELGTLNLDYAEADKRMLAQAKRLKKRFG